MSGKKMISLVFAAMLLMLLALPVQAKQTPVINVVVNGNLVKMEAQPIMVKGRVLVPLRGVAEAMQAKVTWDQELNQVVVRRGMRVIEITIPEVGDEYGGSVYVNGDYTDIDVEPKVLNGRTYVPLRIISEGLGAKTSWNQSTSTVSIEILDIKPLAGMAASVRDSVYLTAVANSYKFNVDAQFQLPDYPLLNVAKFSGMLDKQGNFYANGHAGGWVYEALIKDNQYYLKSALFNNLWVGLDQLIGKESVEEFKREKADYENQYKTDAYDYITETIRMLGEPKVVAEETVNGVLCQKVQFTPTVNSIQAFADLKSYEKNLKGASLTLWIGKDDKLMHKSDFQINSTEYSPLSDKEGDSYIHIIAEFSDINQDFKVEDPGDFKK